MDAYADLIFDFFEDMLGQEPDVVIDILDDEILVDLQLDPEYSGVVIGYRGEVLSSLQLVLSLMIQKAHGDWFPVRLNVNNYREQRAEALEMLAKNTAEEVIQTQKTISLPNLSSYERRLIHSITADIEGVESHSEGEGRNRVLIVAPSK